MPYPDTVEQPNENPNSFFSDRPRNNTMNTMVNLDNVPTQSSAFGRQPIIPQYTPTIQQQLPLDQPQQYGSRTDEILGSLRNREGNYDTIDDIGDGAGLSIGAYQFTEKSGNAQKLAAQLGIKNYSSLSAKDRQSALSKVVGTPQGRQAQDRLVMDQYFKPAQDKAAKYGVTDPKVIEFLVDTNVNGGMNNVISRANKMGGLTMDNLKSARMDRYKNLVNKNPDKYGKFLAGWTNRVNTF